MRYGLSASLVIGLIIGVLASWCPTAPACDGAVQITFYPGLDGYPSWSPDGTQIVFQSTRGDTAGTKNGIWVIPATGGEAVPVTAYNGHDCSPCWSSDGSEIVYVRYKNKILTRLLTVRPTGAMTI
jgi:Tol biopolymer transport system component